MDDLLFYIVMGLLILVFRYTSIVDCEQFSELEIKEISSRKCRVFLRLRRYRIQVGHYLLCLCGFRMAIVYVLIPVINFFCWMFGSDLRYASPLANNTEYCIVGIVCTVLLVIYAKERYLMKEIMKEFDEAG